MDPYIAVVGASVADEALYGAAREVGRLLGERGAVLLSGGLGGVMEASCRGAKEAGGKTIAMLPTLNKDDANDYVDIAIPTGMGEMRNALIVRAADAVIAVGGEFGTLSEIAFALRTDKPVVGLGTWELSKGGEKIRAFETAASPAEVVDLALAAAARARGT
ncbi:MAG TPA: TIGR00725 family protein [Actinomycetota bacterium]|nr:TIGR00725 family protein [Actinomycetota bacterium]